jgi:DnaJ homolog subfamily C member 28
MPPCTCLVRPACVIPTVARDRRSGEPRWVEVGTGLGRGVGTGRGCGLLRSRALAAPISSADLASDGPGRAPAGPFPIRARTAIGSRIVARVSTARNLPGDSRRPASRIDEHGHRQVAPTWESLVERQIREAMEDGRFDALPYRGEPIPLDDDALAGDRAMAFHVLRNAGAAPPWIEADKDVRALLARRDAVIERARARPISSRSTRARDRTELESLVTEANAAIARLNAEAPTDRQHRRPLALAGELARLDADGGGGS